jgi:hypothetical protein
MDTSKGRGLARAAEHLACDVLHRGRAPPGRPGVRKSLSPSCRGHRPRARTRGSVAKVVLTVEMLDRKQAGLPAPVKAFAPPRAVPDPFEAFRQSPAPVEAEAANDETKPARASKPKKPSPKVERQREMLLPIAGGKADAEAKPAKVSASRRKAG